MRIHITRCSAATLARFEAALRPAPGGGVLMAHTDGRGTVTGFEHHGGLGDGARRSGVAPGVAGRPRS